MKTMIQSTLTFFSLLLCTGLMAQIDYQWDYHGVGFTVPDDFKVEVNNADEFSGGSDAVYLSILPYQDHKVDEDDLADVLIEIAKGLEYDDISDADAVKIDDFVGYYVEGEKDGVHAIIATLLDIESSTNLIVIVVYADGYRDLALDMAESFYAYDK